jgi:uncharacterized membrane protein YqjE
MKKLENIFSVLFIGTLSFMFVYLVIMSLGTIVTWSNLFTVDNVLKVVACFFAIIVAFIATLYYSSSED